MYLYTMLIKKSANKMAASWQRGSGTLLCEKVKSFCENENSLRLRPRKTLHIIWNLMITVQTFHKTLVIELIKLDLIDFTYQTINIYWFDSLVEHGNEKDVFVLAMNPAFYLFTQKSSTTTLSWCRHFVCIFLLASSCRGTYWTILALISYDFSIIHWENIYSSWFCEN